METWMDMYEGYRYGMMAFAFYHQGGARGSQRPAQGLTALSMRDSPFHYVAYRPLPDISDGVVPYVWPI